MYIWKYRLHRVMKNTKTALYNYLSIPEVVINGAMMGEIKGRGITHVSPTGRCVGRFEVYRLVVGGVVVGNVTAREILVQSGGELRYGTVQSDSVKVEEGGIYVPDENTDLDANVLFTESPLHLEIAAKTDLAFDVASVPEDASGEQTETPGEGRKVRGVWGDVIDHTGEPCRHRDEKHGPTFFSSYP